MTDMKSEPIKLPLPPGKVLMFDCIKGEVRIEDGPLDAFGGWGNSGMTPGWKR